MLRINKQGFTLIELMVVIVIIGVLASLAIPRFTEASIKAKVAEAPRVIASFESAFLAAVAEGSDVANGMSDLIFESPNDPSVAAAGAAAGSKWFAYTGSITSITNAEYIAETRTNIGGGIGGKSLNSTYSDDGTVTNVSFVHSGDLPKKYAPNFSTNLP
jgi:type IV pilus assembly protein PilA